METGPSGVAGAPVVRHAKKENNPGQENASHQLPSMAGNYVTANQMRSVFATRMFLVQVRTY